MFDCEGIMLPDGERHLTAQLRNKRKNPTVDGRGSYQYGKLERALKWVEGDRVAVDVGAHVGLWSMHLVRRFDRVLAFEPMRLHRQCFKCNVAELHRVRLYACALGERYRQVGMTLDAGSSGNTCVGGAGSVPVCVFDELQPDIDDVDFVKVDCEGFELFVLKGAQAMLERCRPCVIVEQKPGRAQRYGLRETEAVDFLVGLGATLRDEISGDFILSW